MRPSALLTFLILPLTVVAEDCVDYATGDQAWIGVTNTVSDAFNQAVVGNHAYVAGSGISIIDISDPTMPVVESVIEGVGGGVAVDWPYLYSGGTESFSVVDVSSASDPVLLASIPVAEGGLPSDVVYGFDHVFYLSNEDSRRNLVCVDVTDPTLPVVVSSLVLGGDGLYALSLSGNYLYIAHGYEGIDVVDVSNPSSPNLVGNGSTANRALDISLEHPYAYVADRYGGLQILTIEDPLSPSVVGSLPSLGHAYGVDIDDQHAYVSDTSNLYVVNIESPSTPWLVGSLGTGHGYPYVYNVEVEGDLVCAVEGPNWFQIAPIQCGSVGTVVIDVEPEGIAAPWELNGPTGQVLGVGDSILSSMGIGTYSITWGELPDWISPEPDTLELEADGAITFLGIYEPIPIIETFAITNGSSAFDRGYAVLEAVDDGFIIAGRNDSWSTQGEWVFKINDFGEEVWSRHYQSNGYHSFKGLDYSTEGYILTGYSGGAYADLWIMNIDHAGEEVFNELFNTDGAAWNDGNAVRRTTDGGYIAFGRTAWGWPNHAWYLVRTDSAGSLLWEQVYDESTESHDSEAGRDLQQTPDGGFLLVGGYLDNPTDARLVKVDSLGVVEWSQSFGGEAADVFNTVRILENGDYLVAGSTSSYGSGGSDGWLLRLDPTGNEIWSQTFGGSADDGFAAVEADPSGGYILTGATRSEGSGEADLWLVRTDEHGVVLWSRAYGGAEDDDGNDVKPTSDGGYIITGGTQSFGEGNWDAWVLKTNGEGLVDSLVTSVEDESPAYTQGTLLQNYPNPFNPKTVIRFRLPEASQVALTGHDIAGRLVTTLLSRENCESGSHEIVWNGQDYHGRKVASGVYFVRLVAGDHKESMKVVLLK